MVTRGDGSRRQVPDLVGSAKRFTGRHDDPLGVGSDQLVKALYVIGRECGGECLDEIGLLAGTSRRGHRSGMRDHLILLVVILDLPSVHRSQLTS